MQTLYCLLVLSYLHYCMKVLGKTCTTNIKPLFSLQKRAVLIIHKVDSTYNNNIELLIKSGLMKIKDLEKLQILLVIFRQKAKYDLKIYKKNLFFAQRMRTIFNFKNQYAQTVLRQMCMSVWCQTSLRKCYRRKKISINYQHEVAR